MSDDFDLVKLGITQHQAGWPDVEAKARRLNVENRVRVEHKRPYDLNKPTAEIEIRAQVAGDHARYKTVIILPEARSSKIRTFICQCTWNRYVWRRKPIYIVDKDGRRREVNKKFEGRVCSHVLALYWKTQLWPVDYSEVDENVLTHFADKILEQDSLFPSDYEALNSVQEDIEPVDWRRISPEEFGWTDNDPASMNKSIQETLENFFPTVEDAMSPEYMFDDNNSPIEHHFDTAETMVYKKELGELYKNRSSLADRIKQRRRALDRLVDPEKRKPLEKELQELTTRFDSYKYRIQKLNQQINQIYNYEFETQPNFKAQDAVKQLNWYMVNDPQRAKHYMGQLGVRFNAEAEKLDAVSPGSGQRYREEVDQPFTTVNFNEVIQRMVAERAAIELERKNNPPDQRQSSVSVLSTNFEINDITIHLQREVADGKNPLGYVRRELWGEQRGGLHPHPDAMPISIRNDGNHVFSVEDLGYDPNTGEMGSDEEERGTYGRIDVGGEVKIISVDPRDRLVLAEHTLGNPQPNHQHIRLWIPLRDIDLV